MEASETVTHSLNLVYLKKNMPGCTAVHLKLGLYQLFGQNCNQTLMDDFEAVSTVKESQSGSFYAVFDIL